MTTKAFLYKYYAPMYSDEPKAKIIRKIGDKNNRPKPNPTPLPKADASLKITIIDMTTFTTGTRHNKNNHPCPNVILNKTY